jgi:protoporphyrin/coproporphyrin ferrochelatase
MTGPARRIAVVLFNLGGPDGPPAVRPFLFNLFNDPAIIGAPGPIRWLLAQLISRLRTRSAQANYGRMGGGSPLLPETRAQADALGARLKGLLGGDATAIFVSMRYWRPRSDETARAVAKFAPDEVLLAPLYPQFSTTTTASSLRDWAKAYKGPGRVRAVCCYPVEAGFIDAHAARIRSAWDKAGGPRDVRLLFSAHGVPEAVIQRGDPYQSQIEATAAAIAERLGPDWGDWRICYQSRVGPMKWLGPTTIESIEEAVAEGLGVVIAPIAFVSEHVETLVELDHDYAEKAAAMGCTIYVRAPALGVEASFIDGLAGQVIRMLGQDEAIAPGSAFACELRWSRCPWRHKEVQA